MLSTPAYVGPLKVAARTSLTSEPQAYTLSNHITNGSPNTEKRCREAQASTAFLWFGWAAFVASMIISVLAGRSGGASFRGGIRRPAMSQV